MAKKSSRPDEPDLAILLVAANRVLVDRLMAAMDRAGLTMRPSWGYVIRALHAEPLPLARLAERLDVTKQAALQTVDDMAAAGLVERRADPDDGRRKLLALTDDGRAGAGDGAGRQRGASRPRSASATRPPCARALLGDGRAPRRPRARCRAGRSRALPALDRGGPGYAAAVSGSRAAPGCGLGARPPERSSTAHSAAETSANDARVEEDRVQALEERARARRAGPASPPPTRRKHAERDEVGELARALVPRGGLQPRAPRPPRRTRSPAPLTTCVKTAPSAAVPVAMPTCRNVELMPEAMPVAVRLDDADRGSGQRRVDRADPATGDHESGEHRGPVVARARSGA